MGVDLNVIGKSYSMLFRNRTLLVIGAAGSVLSALLALFISAPIQAAKSNPTALTQLMSSPSFIVGAALSVVVSVFLSVLIMAAMIDAASDGDKAKLGNSLKVAVSRYIALFCTGIVSGLVVFLALTPGLALMIGGVVLNLAASAISSFTALGNVSSLSMMLIAIGLVLMVPGIYVSIRLSLAQVACVAGGKRTFESLDNSWMVARGNLWGIFIVILVLGIADGLVGGIVSVINSTAGSFVSALLAYPITIAMVLIYMQLSKGK